MTTETKNTPPPKRYKKLGGEIIPRVEEALVTDDKTGALTPMTQETK